MAKDTKERILAAALEMFSQKGSEGTSIRDLSASSGWSSLVFTSVLRARKPSGMVMNWISAAGQGMLPWQTVGFNAALGMYLFHSFKRM